MNQATHKPTAAANLPLAGIRVLDVSQVMAGPFPVPGTPFKLGADIQLKLKKPPGKN